MLYESFKLKNLKLELVYFHFKFSQYKNIYIENIKLFLGLLLSNLKF